MMKYASCFTANSGVRTVPSASDTGMSISEYLYLCAVGPPAIASGARNNVPNIQLTTTVSCHPSLLFMPFLHVKSLRIRTILTVLETKSRVPARPRVPHSSRSDDWLFGEGLGLKPHETDTQKSGFSPT